MTATSTTVPSTTASSTTMSTTTVAMTSIFTPPAACATSWTYEPENYNDFPSGLLMQNCETVVSSCFPSQFAGSGRKTETVVYSPGYCPMGYTSANLAISGETTTAVCCQSDFAYTTSTMIYSNLPSAIYAGCTSVLPSSNSTIVSARASASNEGTMVFGPLTMWAQPITVLLQSSDSSLFASSTSSSSSSSTPLSTSSSETISTTTSYSTTSPTATSQPSPQPSTGLSTGAKAGIGIGVGVGVIAILTLVGWWLHGRRAKNAPAAMGSPYYGNHDFSGNTAPMAGSAIKSGPPVEMDSSSAKLTNPVSELQG